MTDALVAKKRVGFTARSNTTPETQSADLLFPDIEWDVSENETHSSAARVTSLPVETGANIADHVIQESDTLTLSLRQSNYPVVNSRSPEGQKLLRTMSPHRAEDTYDALLAMKNKGDLIFVVTTLRIYDNMVIERLVVTRNAQLGRVVSVTVDLKQVRSASSLSVPIPIPRDTRAKGIKDDGLMSMEVVPENADAKFTLLNYFTGLTIKAAVPEFIAPP